MNGMNKRRPHLYVLQAAVCSVTGLLNQRKPFSVQLFVDGIYGPVPDVQVIDDNCVKCDARVQNSVLGDAKRVLRLGQCHMAGNAKRKNFYAGRVLLVSVDDLVGVMLLEITFRNDVSKQQAFLMHDTVQIVAQRQRMLIALERSKVFI